MTFLRNERFYLILVMEIMKWSISPWWFISPNFSLPLTVREIWGLITGPVPSCRLHSVATVATRLRSRISQPLVTRFGVISWVRYNEHLILFLIWNFGMCNTALAFTSSRCRTFGHTNHSDERSERSKQRHRRHILFGTLFVMKVKTRLVRTLAIES